jgi:hypothetical protein
MQGLLNDPMVYSSFLEAIGDIIGGRQVLTRKPASLSSLCLRYFNNRKVPPYFISYFLLLVSLMFDHIFISDFFLVLSFLSSAPAWQPCQWQNHQIFACSVWYAKPHRPSLPTVNYSESCQEAWTQPEVRRLPRGTLLLPVDWKPRLRLGLSAVVDILHLLAKLRYHAHF